MEMHIGLGFIEGAIQQILYEANRGGYRGGLTVEQLVEESRSRLKLVESERPGYIGSFQVSPDMVEEFDLSGAVNIALKKCLYDGYITKKEIDGELRYSLASRIPGPFFE